jgi:hypothetical protein
VFVIVFVIVNILFFFMKNVFSCQRSKLKEHNVLGQSKIFIKNQHFQKNEKVLGFVIFKYRHYLKKKKNETMSSRLYVIFKNRHNVRK